MVLVPSRPQLSREMRTKDIYNLVGCSKCCDGEAKAQAGVQEGFLQEVALNRVCPHSYLMPCRSSLLDRALRVSRLSQVSC